MFSALIVSLALLLPEVTMSQLNLQTDTQLTLYKTENGYLLNSRLESKAILFSPSGQVLARYERRGQGPNEFNNQFVLKVDEQGIYFCTNGRFVIGFDQGLKLTGKKLGVLPSNANINAMYGLLGTHNSVIVPLGGRSHLFMELQDHHGQWQVKGQYYPSETTNLWDGRNYLFKGKRPLVHNHTMFSSRMTVTEREASYEVEIYNGFLANKMKQSVTGMLMADVEGFPSFMGIRAIIYGVVKTPTGYIVELFSHRNPNGSFKRWHDVFNAKGQFIKRIAKDGTRILPVMNSDEAFLLEDGARWNLKKIF